MKEIRGLEQKPWKFDIVRIFKVVWVGVYVTFAFALGTALMFIAFTLFTMIQSLV